jgi:hypothetical protein
MRHGPEKLPVAKAVRLKEREAAFRERMQHGIPTAQPLPVAKAVRLKEREASFLQKMQHGKPRQAPPVGASWERKSPSRAKRSESLFQTKHQRKSAEAAAIRGMVAPSHSTLPGKKDNPLAGGGELGSREVIELLRRIATALEAQASESQQRDTGQLPPKDEPMAKHEGGGIGHVVRAGIAGAHGHDPVGNALKEAGKEVVRGAVRSGIMALLGL